MQALQQIKSNLYLDYFCGQINKASPLGLRYINNIIFLSMSTFLSLIIASVILMVIHFTRDTLKEKNKVQNQGGIRKKYKTLITHFLVEGEMKVISETTTYMCISGSDNMARITFHFQHLYSSINVKFEFKNIIIGEHKLSWDFPENMSQEDMIEHIETEINKYFDNLCSRLYS